MTFIGQQPSAGPTLLLDTCVYIDVLQDTFPAEGDRLLRARNQRHLSIVIGELSHNFGRLAPDLPATGAILATLASVINDIRAYRIDDSISAGVLLEAGILAGLVFRLGGFQPGQEIAALNDATIYLHALEKGYVVLTRNIRDFDLMQQIVPQGRVIYYR